MHLFFRLHFGLFLLAKPAAALTSLPCFSAAAGVSVSSHDNISHQKNVAFEIIRGSLFTLAGAGLLIQTHAPQQAQIKETMGGCCDACINLYVTHALPYWPISCLALQQWIRSVSFQTAREEFSQCQSSPPGQTWWRGGEETPTASGLKRCDRAWEGTPKRGTEPGGAVSRLSRRKSGRELPRSGSSPSRTGRTRSRAPRPRAASGAAAANGARLAGRAP